MSRRWKDTDFPQPEGGLEAAVDNLIERGEGIKMKIGNLSGLVVEQEEGKAIPGRDDWMTPGWLVQYAREVLGEIDLDPCSSDEANQVVQAKTYYTKDMDGLAQGMFFGNVFMNPPYSRGIIDQFIDRLCDSYAQGSVQAAFVITNNVTETGWAHRLLASMGAMCLPKGRIHFVLPGGKLATQTRQGQILWYLGKEQYHAASVLEDLGVILSRF